MTVISALADLRTNVESGLADAALTRLWYDAEELVEQRFGAVDSQVDEFVVDDVAYPFGRDKLLTLTRPVVSITSITEQWFDDSATTLASDDYDQRRRILERLDSGTNPQTYWGHRVIVTYVPVDQTNRRVGVVIDLVKLQERYEGVKSEKVGDYQMTAPDYERERNQILARLGTGMPF